MRSLELKIPPLVLLLLSVVLMYALAIVLPQWRLPLPYKSALALAWAGAGGVVAALGVWAFRRQRTSVNPVQPEAASQIVRSGIFRYSRNPMYLGFALLLMGWALWLAHPVAFAVVPLFVLWLHAFQIKPEERILLQKFGAPYAQYLREVRRWV